MVSIAIHEGRNRQVRKMFDAIGHPVVSLRRVRIGPISDPRLKPGEFRELSEAEVRALKKAQGSGLKAQGASRSQNSAPKRKEADDVDDA